jgi:transposase
MYNSIIKGGLIMPRKSKQHDKQFKLDAIKYVNEHPDLTQEECCKNLGIGLSTLSRWKSQYLDNDGDIPTRGSGNYASDEQKEIARLKRELRDTQDALDVLKKAIGILGKN